MDELRKKLGARVKSLRKSLQFTQQELSEFSGVSIRHLQDIETAKADVKLTMLHRLAESLQVEPFELLQPFGREANCPKKENGIVEKKQSLSSASLSPNFYAPLDYFPLPLHILDENGLVHYCNLALTKIHGYSQKEVGGKMSIWDFYSSEREKSDLKKYLKYLVKNQPEPKPNFGVYKHKKGKLVRLRIDWQYIRASRRKVEGFFAVFSREEEC